MLQKPAPLSTESGSLGRTARTSVLWAYVRTFIVGLASIPSTILLARMLTPADFGIAAAAILFGRLSSKLASGGFGLALVRVKELRQEHISTVFVLNVVTAAAGSLALLVGAPYIAAFYGAPQVGWVMPVVALNFVLGALSMVQQALLSRDLRYREMATIGSIDVLVAALTAVTFAWFGLGFWSLVFGDVCGSFVKWMCGVWYAGWHVRFRFVPAAAREMMSFAAGSYVRRLLEYATQNIDSLFIGRLLGVTALGFYDKAFSVGNKIFQNMVTVGPSISFRIFAIIQDDPSRFRRAFRKVIMSVTLLGYVVLAALGTMSPHLIVVTLGEVWRPSVLPLQLLCIAFAFKLLNRYATAAAQACGWIWPQIWRQVVQILCIVVGVTIAQPWGLVGASVAVVGANLIMFFLTQGMMRAATGLGWSDVLRPQLPAVTAATLLIATLWAIDALMAGASAMTILALQTTGALTFLVAFAWWCPFTDARVLLYEIASDLSPRLASLVWKDVAVSARPKGVRQSAPPSPVG